MNPSNTRRSYHRKWQTLSSWGLRSLSMMILVLKVIIATIIMTPSCCCCFQHVQGSAAFAGIYEHHRSHYRGSSLCGKNGLAVTFKSELSCDVNINVARQGNNVPIMTAGSRRIQMLPTMTMTTTTMMMTSSPKDTSEVGVNVDIDIEKIRSMRVKELKASLSELRIPTNDVFDKEELVLRLIKARKDGIQQQPKQAYSSPSSVITVPLYFTTMDANMKIAAVNMDGGIQVDPNMQPYATMQIYIQDPSSSPPQKLFPLRLLVDTACSGFVLRPSVVQQKYRFLPSLSTPVTMTGAGGTASATGLTQIDRFTLDAADQETTAIKFGPLPAAVQDIGALPSSLDGIIGLSFLNQFAKVDFDFERGRLRLQKSIATATTTDEGLSLNDSNLVGRADLEIVPQLGIYTVDVSFDVDNQRRGPVKMLVDTGAANTFLSWKGVNDLGFSRDSSSSSMQTLDIASAAMGSDNVAMRLTHRLTVDEKMYIGSNATSRGLSLNSVNKAKALSIDIGEITLLEQLRFFGIGGILGIDALMRCSHVVLQLQGPKKTLSLYGP